MAQQSPSRRSFGPTFRTLSTISPIPEEPVAKEGHTEGSFGPSDHDNKKESKPSKTSSSSKKPIATHQSFMFQNGQSSILSPTLRAPDSVIGTSSSKMLKKFGTFAGEPSKKDLAAMASPSGKDGNDKVTMRIIDKDDWVVGSNCNLCKREFKTMNGVFQHHCRVCGMAVCGECSSKKINDNRVCDMCYYKVNNPRAERRREDQLKSKDATRRTYKKQLQREKDELDQLISKKYEIDKKMKEEKEDQVKDLTSLQKEKDKASEILVKKKETNMKLKETLAVDKMFLKDKETEYDELRNKINALKVQIGQKKNNYELKKEELTRIVRQIKSYEESPSFINLLNSIPPNGSDSVVDGGEGSTMSIAGITNRVSLRRDLTKI